MCADANVQVLPQGEYNYGNLKSADLMQEVDSLLSQCRQENPNYKAVAVFSPFFYFDSNNRNHPGNDMTVNDLVNSRRFSEDSKTLIRQCLVDETDNYLMKLFSSFNAVRDNIVKNDRLPPNGSVVDINEVMRKKSHAKFIALLHLNGKTVDVIVTSANLNKENMPLTGERDYVERDYSNLDSLIVLRMTLEEFEKKYLTPHNVRLELAFNLPGPAENNPNEEIQMIQLLVEPNSSIKLIDHGVFSKLPDDNQVEIKNKLDDLIDNTRDKAGTIYAATPFIDNHFMGYLKKKLKYNRCNAIVIFRNGQNVENPLPNRIQLFPKTTPRDNYFHTKLICFVPENNDEKADLLLTSANFTEWHIQFPGGDDQHNLDWILRVKIDKEEFEKKYRNPLYELDPEQQRDQPEND